MEIRAKNDETIKNYEAGKSYRLLGGIYVVAAFISLFVFFFWDSNINFIVTFIISFVNTIWMFFNNAKIKSKQYEMTDCYIRTSKNYLEFKQLVEGKYQIGKVNINEINKVMKVNDGFQIWFDDSSDNSRVMIDEDIMQTKTVCVNFYGFDTDQYIDIYLDFISRLNEKTDKELDIAEWSKKDSNSFMKMLLPAFLYLIPIILNIFNLV